MRLPFSLDQFLDTFAAYNLAFWPAAAALWLATLGGVLQLVRGRVHGGGLAALLAVHWIWSGLAYHALHFSRINPLAPVFAALFVSEGVALVWAGVIRRRLAFVWGRSFRHAIAGLLLLGGLAYPLAAWLTAENWPRVPTFGVPCPTMLVTAGCLLATAPPAPRGLSVIPVAWALVGGSAALLLGVTVDLMLFAGARGHAVSPGHGRLRQQ